MGRENLASRPSMKIVHILGNVSGKKVDIGTRGMEENERHNHRKRLIEPGYPLSQTIPRIIIPL